LRIKNYMNNIVDQLCNEDTDRNVTYPEAYRPVHDLIDGLLLHLPDFCPECEAVLENGKCESACCKERYL